MEPIPFKQQTMVIAENQPEYANLPSWVGPDGEVITRWRMTWRERLSALFCGRIWVRVLSFGTPLQPMAIQTEYPWEATPTQEDKSDE